MTEQGDNKRSVYLETFGCQMNVLDSQLVTSQLRGLGYRFVDDWKQADVILYNTCSVRQHAEDKVYSRIGTVGRHKEHYPDKVLGVIGCMAEREGEDLVKRYPQIDLMCGPGELDKVPMLIDNVVRTNLSERRRPIAEVALQGNTHRRTGTLGAAADDLEMLDLSRAFQPLPEKGQAERAAYVRITRGCNKFCTYCVVPNTRGAEVHRPPDHIVDECKRLVEAGVVEITLLGQTVNHYHYDHAVGVTIEGVQQPQIGAAVKNRGNTFEAAAGATTLSDHVTTFADLLARIHDEIPGLRRLRFITNFPRDFGDDILQVMADRPRICRYLHLPVQSASDRMLKAMNRGYTIAEFDDLLVRARRFLPDVQLASDVICGFPGETEDDHRATCKLLERARFKNCFIFKYSPRPGTTAYDRLPDDVPDDVKKRRNNELLAIQSRASQSVHDGFVGQTVEVYVESISAKTRKNRNAADPAVQLGWQQDDDDQVVQLTGRTGGDLIVMFEGDESLVGTFAQVHVERAAPLALFGHAVRSVAAG